MYRPRRSKSSDDSKKIANIIKNAIQESEISDINYVEIEKLLASSNVNARIDFLPYRDTLMHFAVRKNFNRLFEMFLRKGGDVNATNGSNETVAYLGQTLCDGSNIVTLINEKLDAIMMGKFEALTTTNADLTVETAKLVTNVFGSDQSVLKSVIRSGKMKNFELMLKKFKNLFGEMPFEHKKSIVELAVKMNLTEMVLKLLKIDFPFPDVDIASLSNDIKQLISERQILHGNNLNKIKSLVEQMRKQNDSFVRLGFCVKNQSAIYSAILQKEYGIYSYLLTKGFIAKNCEEEKISKIIEKLPDNIQRRIGSENLRNSMTDKKSYLRILATKFAIFNFYKNQSDYDAKFDLILSYLIELNEIAEIKPLLEFCGELDGLKVGVDLKNRDLAKFDPSSSDSCGVSYCERKIVFVSGGNKSKIMETMVHEMLHVALEHFYENDSKPYYEHDTENRRIFQGIVKNIQDRLKINPNDQCGNLISDVFKCYEPEQYDEEIAVKVLEIHSTLASNQPKLDDLKDIYQDLFDYSMKNITSALKINVLKERQAVRSLNADFGVIKKINYDSDKFKLKKNDKRLEIIQNLFKNDESRVVVTNVPMLAMIDILKYLKSTQYSLFDAKNLFISSNSVQTQKIYEILFKSQNPPVIITNTGENFGNFKVISVIDQNESNASPKINLFYSWKDLFYGTREDLLTTRVDFHGMEVSLNEIVDHDFMADKLSKQLVTDLCNNKKISINSVTTASDDYFIERCFVKPLPEDDFLKSLPRNVSEKIMSNIRQFKMDEIIQMTENEKIVLISDIGGSGKSRILKRIFNTFVETSNKWLIFINLREFWKEFKFFKGKRNFLNFFDSVLSKKIKNFEKRIFKKFYEQGKVQIMMDGFDEISPHYKEIVLDILESIKSSEFKNQLWITTRLHLEINLQKILNAKEVFSLKSIESEQQKEFLVKYWKFKKIRDDNLTRHAADLVKKFSSFSSKKGNLIGIMQQLKILADICIENDSITTEPIESFTMYQIYEHSVRNYMNIWQNSLLGSEKSSEIQCGLEKPADFQSVHQFFALPEFFHDENIEIFFTNIWDLESVARGGIITYYPEEKEPIFIHATYRDYFIANFILECLLKHQSWSHYRAFIDIFIDVLCNSYFVTCQMFINEKLSDLIHKFSDEKFQFIAEILIDYTPNAYSEFKFDFFALPLTHNYENIVTFLLKIIHKMDDEMKRKIIVDNAVDSALYRYMLVTNSFKMKTFNEFFTLTLSLVSDDEFLELFRKMNFGGLILLHSFTRKVITIDVMKIIMNEIEKKSKNKNVRRILLNVDAVQAELAIFTMLRNVDEEGLKKLEYFWEFHEKHLSEEEMMVKILHQVIVACSRARSGVALEFAYEKFKNKFDFLEMLFQILNEFADNKNISVHKALWKCIKIEMMRRQNDFDLEGFLQRPIHDGNNFIHFLIVIQNDEEIVKFTLSEIQKLLDNDYEFRELLMSKGHNGLNIIQNILIVPKPLTYYESILGLVRKYLTQKVIKQFILSSNDRAYNVLYTIIDTPTDDHLLPFFMNYLNQLNMTDDEIRNLFTPTIEGVRLNFLKHAAKVNNSLETHKILWHLAEKYYKNEILNLITERVIDEDEQIEMNLLELTVIHSRLEVLDFTWTQIKKHLTTKSEQRNYLASKNSEDENLYEQAAANEDYNCEAWVINLMDEYEIDIPYIFPNQENDLNDYSDYSDMSSFLSRLSESN